MSSRKRPHVTLTLQQKNEIIELLNRGVPYKQVAAKYGVGTSTISDIKKKKNSIQEFIANCGPDPGSRKTLRKSPYHKMEKLLYMWLVRQRSKEPVSYEVLTKKAKLLFTQCYGKGNFNASNGWIIKFKNRHGLRSLKIDGEHLLTNDANAVDPFEVKLLKFIKEKDLLPSQIYKADVSGLYWKLLPEEALLTSKERLTFLACCNADATNKLKLLVTGKTFSRQTTLDVEYQVTKDASVTFDIIKTWFNNSFLIQVQNFCNENNLPQKALLLVDQSPTISHATEKKLISNDGLIKTMFIPWKCTALTQLIDKNAVRLMKLYYKKHILSYLLRSEQKDIAKCLKGIGLNDAVSFLHEVWYNLPSTLLKRCYALEIKRGPDDLSTIIAENNVRQEILRLIQEIAPNVALTEAEVDCWLNEDGADDNEENEDNVRETFLVGHDVATKCFQQCIAWAEENGVPSDELSVLRKLRDKASLLSGMKIEQE